MGHSHKKTRPAKRGQVLDPPLQDASKQWQWVVLVALKINCICDIVAIQSDQCDTVVLDWVKPQKVVLGSVIVHCNKKASVGQAEKATIEVIKTRARVPFASGDVSFTHWLVLESLEWPFWRLKYCLYIILIPNIDYKTGRFQRAPIQDKSKERNEYIVLE